MLITIDVGNTNITVGVFEGEDIRATFRITTKMPRTSDEYGMLLLNLLEQNDISPKEIDDVIIANAYASEEELQALGALNKEKQTFDIEIYDTTTELERIIVLNEPHFYRGDVSEYMIRSTQSRVKYKKEEFKPHNTREIKRGDLLIDNEQYGQYKGELQIALKDMVNTGKTNVVGRIVEEEIFLLDYLQAWDKFGFTLKK